MWATGMTSAFTVLDVSLIEPKSAPKNGELERNELSGLTYHQCTNVF